MKHQLYFVRGSTPEGTNQDLLVVAGSETQARQFWESYYDKLQDSEDIQWVGAVPGVVPNVQPGPISWEVIHK